MGGCLSRKKTFDPSKDLLDLTGKVILVTGGNTGIGYETVKHLARRGAKIYLGARDESKATGAMAKLQHEGLGPGNGKIVWLKLTGPFEKTNDGISKLMTVNHFGPYIFTRTLLPLLIKTSKEPNSDVRIVTLSSLAHRSSRAALPDVKFQRIEDFNEEFPDDVYPDWSRYSLTKLANVLWMRELQKRIDASGAKITCMSVNPGTVNTFAARTPFPIIAAILFALFFDTPEIGAYTPCFAAASSEVRADPLGYKGTFIEPVGVITEPSENARNDQLAKELWETTESVLKNAGI